MFGILSSSCQRTMSYYYENSERYFRVARLESVKCGEEGIVPNPKMILNVYRSSFTWVYQVYLVSALAILFFSLLFVAYLLNFLFLLVFWKRQ